MPSAAVYDCEGPRLLDKERAFFREVDPWGFILFARHCQSPDQMKVLTAELRESVGRDAPILIDQEGGRVARMRTQDGMNAVWQTHPPMSVFGDLWRLNPESAKRAVWLNGFLLGEMISSCGVNVDCAPMVDIRQLDSDPVTIGDRSIAGHSDIVVPIAKAFMAGLQEGGALPIIKHMPGLGRALCDSHYDLPVVPASIVDLRTIDFEPFRALCNAPMGMTGHVVYPQLDREQCATQSVQIIETIIRGEIGFDGLLFSDDIKMEALGGPYSVRAKKSLEAGCDIALACNFSLHEKQEIAGAVGNMEGKTLARAKTALQWVSDECSPDIERSYPALYEMLKPVWPVQA